MKKIIRLLATLLVLLFPSRFYNLFAKFKIEVYSKYIKTKIRESGVNFLVMAPMMLRGGNNVTIGDNFYCYWGVRIETYTEHNGIKFNPKIIIGNNVSFNPHCHIAAINRIEIHDGVMLASRVFITDDNHELTKDAIAVHSHRYSLGITVLKGYIHHRLYFPTKDVFPYNDAIRLQSFRYHSKLNENKGCFSKYGGSMLFDTNLSVLHPNSYIYLKSSDLHDVYCLQQVNAWLCVEGKDNYSYNKEPLNNF